MVEGFAAATGRFNGDGNVFLDAFLADVFGERFRSHAGVEARIIVERSTADDPLGAIGRVGEVPDGCALWSGVGHVDKRIAANTNQHVAISDQIADNTRRPLQ